MYFGRGVVKTPGHVGVKWNIQVILEFVWSLSLPWKWRLNALVSASCRQRCALSAAQRFGTVCLRVGVGVHLGVILLRDYSFKSEVSCITRVAETFAMLQILSFYLFVCFSGCNWGKIRRKNSKPSQAFVPDIFVVLALIVAFFKSADGHFRAVIFCANHSRVDPSSLHTNHTMTRKIHIKPRHAIYLERQQIIYRLGGHCGKVPLSPPAIPSHTLCLYWPHFEKTCLWLQCCHKNPGSVGQPLRDSSGGDWF